MLKKECSEWDDNKGRWVYFDKYLHLQALKEVPEEVTSMAWINRGPSAPGTGEA